MPELTHDIQVIGSLIFAVALVHTFIAGKILKLSHKYPKGSGLEALLHLLGEVEVVFGFWGAIMLVVFAIYQSPKFAVGYHSSLNFTEPIFIFCIMIVAATRPVLEAVEALIGLASKVIQNVFRFPQMHSDLLAILILGPLSGSLITEPAAMTVTALLLASRIRSPAGSFIYFLLGTLYVNVSIGGALTSFAAPPILMVAQKWGWDTSFVFTQFGWKVLLAVVINATVFIGVYYKTIYQACWDPQREQAAKTEQKIPVWVSLLQFMFLAAVVLSAHYPALCLGIFLFFVGFTMVTKNYQTPMRIKQSLLVAFFLAGIVMFGPLQKWWLEPILSGLNAYVLGLAATALTAITDNAALTFLGAQIEGLTESAKYFLVAGAIAGGGLTIIANAPNAAGYSILQKFFPDGLNPGKLLIGALLPTLVAVILLAIY